VLLQHLDDLLFGKSALTHVRLPKERTLPKIGGIYGEQVTHLRPRQRCGGPTTLVPASYFPAQNYQSFGLAENLLPSGKLRGRTESSLTLVAAVDSFL